MKILLTGAGGFLGRAVQAHWEGRHSLIPIVGRAEFAAQLERAPASDWLLHAGFEVSFREDPGVEARNRASTEAVIRYFRSGKGKRLLFLSAAGAMGVGRANAPRDEALLGRTDPGFEGYRDTAYIRGKLEAEKMFREAGIPLTVLYLTTVYGPGMPEETLAAARNSRLAPPGGTSLLGLQDFLAALDLVITGEPEGEGYLLNGANLTFAELYAAARGRRNYVVLPRAARPLLALAGIFLGKRLLSAAVLDSAFGYKYYSAEKFRARYPWRPVQDAVSLLRG